jgi:hypothetical protein
MDFVNLKLQRIHLYIFDCFDRLIRLDHCRLGHPDTFSLKYRISLSTGAPIRWALRGGSPMAARYLASTRNGNLSSGGIVVGVESGFPRLSLTETSYVTLCIRHSLPPLNSSNPLIASETSKVQYTK